MCVRVWVGLYVCVRVCVVACMGGFVRVCACVCVRVLVSLIDFEPNISVKTLNIKKKIITAEGNVIKTRFYLFFDARRK
jgi:hypothetical protein